MLWIEQLSKSAYDSEFIYFTYKLMSNIYPYKSSLNFILFFVSLVPKSFFSLETAKSLEISWPGLHIVHGWARKPEKQGSVESSYGDWQGISEAVVEAVIEMTL